MANSQFDERIPILSQRSLVVGDGSGITDIASFADIVRWDALYLANLDSIAHAYTVWLQVSAEPDVAIASGTLPALAAGVAGVVEVFHDRLPPGVQYLLLPPSVTVSVSLAIAVTGDDLFKASLLGGRF
jgi:hypothetical protein